MDDLTEREKMLAGQLYRAFDPELVAERAKARRLAHAYNADRPRGRDEAPRALVRAVR